MAWRNEKGRSDPSFSTRKFWCPGQGAEQQGPERRHGHAGAVNHGWGSSWHRKSGVHHGHPVVVTMCCHGRGLAGPSSWAQAVGPIAGKCDGVDFEISGQQVTAKDLSTCGIQGAEYDVPGMGWDGMKCFHGFSMGFPWVFPVFRGEVSWDVWVLTFRKLLEFHSSLLSVAPRSSTVPTRISSLYRCTGFQVFTSASQGLGKGESYPNGHFNDKDGDRP